MNGYLVDTNVISEVTKPSPAQEVLRWLDQAPPHATFVSVITLGELRIGVEGMSFSRRRSELEAWLESGLPTWFASNLLPVSANIADRWARLTIQAKRNGTSISMADALIAATAAEHQLILVTRNTKDFVSLPVELLNPWQPF